MPTPADEDGRLQDDLAVRFGQVGPPSAPIPTTVMSGWLVGGIVSDTLRTLS